MKTLSLDSTRPG